MARRTHRFFLVALFVLVIPSLAHSDPYKTSFAAKQVRGVHGLMDRIMAKEHLPGMIAAIWEGKPSPGFVCGSRKDPFS